MYIHVHEIVKCSSCGSIDNYEHVTRPNALGAETFIRCLKCGHEKLQNTLTVSNTTTGSIKYESIHKAVNEF